MVDHRGEIREVDKDVKQAGADVVTAAATAGITVGAALAGIIQELQNIAAKIERIATEMETPGQGGGPN